MDDRVALNNCYLCRKRNIRDKANVKILNFSSLDLDLYRCGEDDFMSFPYQI